jgi:hypothetical protein
LCTTVSKASFTTLLPLLETNSAKLVLPSSFYLAANAISSKRHIILWCCII